VSSYDYVLATTAADLEAAMSVRRAVFVEEIGVPDRQDGDDARAAHIVAKMGGEIVGTSRVLGDGAVGEGHYDLAPLRRAGVRFVEVARTSVLRAHRSATLLGNLWKAVYQYAAARGREHFVTVVHVGYTDSIDDAELVYTALARRGLLHPRHELSLRAPSPRPDRALRPLFSAAERVEHDTLKLPTSMRLFHRFGLRACGKPTFLREIGRVGLPMLAGPDTFSEGTLAFFRAPDPTIRVAP
jgi:hypothetical protein